MTSSPNDPKAILPEGWLSGPLDAPLPVEYSGAVYDKLDGDAYLTWKSQEYLARTGRMAECDADLVADALRQAAKADGPGAVRDALREIMGYLAWPQELGHRDSLNDRLRTAAEQLDGAMTDSPSVSAMFDDRAIAAEWRRAVHHVDLLLGRGKGDRMRQAYPCPWASLDDVMQAVLARLGAEAQERLVRSANAGPSSYHITPDHPRAPELLALATARLQAEGISAERLDGAQLIVAADIGTFADEHGAVVWASGAEENPICAVRLADDAVVGVWANSSTMDKPWATGAGMAALLNEIRSMAVAVQAVMDALPEADADQLADALQQAVTARGPEAVRKPLRQLLAALAWPITVGRSDVLQQRLLAAAELLEQAMAECPAEAAQITGNDIDAAWRRACADVAVQLARNEAAADAVVQVVPCPWTTLDQVLAAARERAAAIRPTAP